ncbi:MAG: hypothetical protein M1596_05220 [Firmicutes bacterium]|nr:hypothetical protein [Bacillota bacterium]
MMRDYEKQPRLTKANSVVRTQSVGMVIVAVLLTLRPINSSTTACGEKW